MIPLACQRWRDRRGLYRPLGEPINPRDYEVAEIPTNREAKAFIERHHYSGRFASARARFGLYERGGELVGVAVFGMPMPNAAPEARGDDRVELNRFVLLDRVPSNGESWFLARCFEALRSRTDCIIAFADPEPRIAPDGTKLFPGHLGTIYQATNAIYIGRGPRSTWRLFGDGTVLSARGVQKLRRGERGRQAVVAQLVSHGAAAPGPGEDLRSWASHWVPLLTRTLRHGGCHRYVWSRSQPDGQPYPKWPLTTWPACGHTTRRMP